MIDCEIWCGFLVILSMFVPISFYFVPKTNAWREDLIGRVWCKISDCFCVRIYDISVFVEIKCGYYIDFFISKYLHLLSCVI